MVGDKQAGEVHWLTTSNSGENGIQDVCVLAHAVPYIAKYLPGTKDHRVKPKLVMAS